MFKSTITKTEKLLKAKQKCIKQINKKWQGA